MAAMNMRFLRSFLAVAEERSSVRAAQRLGLPRQSVTQHVAAVEKAVGLKLLEAGYPREPRQVGRTQLTEQGRVFYPKALAAMRAHDDLFEERVVEQDPRDLRLAVLHGLLELALDAARNNLADADGKLLNDILLNAGLQGSGVPAGRLRRSG